jgi:hypothetical protein
MQEVAAIKVVDEPKRRPDLSLVPLGFALLVVTYLSSMGPSYRLLRKGSMRQQTFSSMCAPILRLSHRSTVVDRALDWYLEIWYSDEREIIRQMQQWKSQTK